jgi:hypothetical protein
MTTEFVVDVQKRRTVKSVTLKSIFSAYSSVVMVQKFVFLRAVKAFRDLKYGDSHSFNPCLSVVRVYRFALRNSPRYPLIKRQGGPHIRSGPAEEDINLLPVPGIRNCWQKLAYKKRTRHIMPYARL